MEGRNATPAATLAQVAVLSIKAAGVGLTMTAASTVVFAGESGCSHQVLVTSH